MEPLKRFLRPTVPTVVFFAAEAALTAYACRKTLVFDSVVFVGFPFGFWPVGLPGWANLGLPMPGIRWLHLTADVAAWWAIAAGFGALWRLAPGRKP